MRSEGKGREGKTGKGMEGKGEKEGEIEKRRERG